MWWQKCQPVHFLLYSNKKNFSTHSNVLQTCTSSVDCIVKCNESNLILTLCHAACSWCRKCKGTFALKAFLRLKNLKDKLFE